MRSFNDLYLDYDDEELEIKMALQSVIRDEKVVNEAVKHYQMGKAQDLIYAEQQLAKGTMFNTVHKTITSNIKKRSKARPIFDNKLRTALIRAGKLPDLLHDYQAHHIVAKGDARAARAVQILKALGIDVDDPDNGIFLPATSADRRKGSLSKGYVHNKIHTNAYHANVTFHIVRLFEKGAHKSDSELKKDIIKKLQEIGHQLSTGVFPIHAYVPGAEIYGGSK